MTDKRIVVAYDGSPDSEKALKLAVLMAKALLMEVVLVSVVDTAHLVQDEFGSLIGIAEELPGTEYVVNEEVETAPRGAVSESPVLDKAKQVLENGCRRAEALGLPATGVALRGNPAEAICDYAKDQQASMIVAGTRGLGGFPRLLLGSTAQALITYSQIPVLIAK